MFCFWLPPHILLLRDLFFVVWVAFLLLLLNHIHDLEHFLHCDLNYTIPADSANLSTDCSDLTVKIFLWDLSFIEWQKESKLGFIFWTIRLDEKAGVEKFWVNMKPIVPFGTSPLQEVRLSSQTLGLNLVERSFRERSLKRPIRGVKIHCSYKKLRLFLILNLFHHQTVHKFRCGAERRTTVKLVLQHGKVASDVE